MNKEPIKCDCCGKIISEEELANNMFKRNFEIKERFGIDEYSVIKTEYFECIKCAPDDEAGI